MTELERKGDTALSPRGPREEAPPELGPEDDVPMSFFDHLSELRQCLARASLGVLVGFGVSFLFVSELLAFLKAPLETAWVEAQLPGRPNLQVLEIQGALMTDVRIGLTAGIFLAGPVIFYQVWRLSRQGYIGKRSAFWCPLCSSRGHVLPGGLFAYEVVLPFALRWLLDYTDLGFLGTFLTERDLNPMGQLQYQLELSKYVRGSTRILLAFATVFEMPLVVAALAKMQVLSHRTLLKFWRVAIVLIFILAAFLTPPEPVTQFMMALPMVILFFTSVLVAFILNPAGRVSSQDEHLDDDPELPAEP